MKGKCNDSNPKIVSRTYDLSGITGEFKLCKDCSIDPLFSDYVKEEKLQ